MPNETVTSAVVALDKVAVNVSVDPEFSLIELAEVDSVTVGALSFSVIVIVSDCVPFSEADPSERHADAAWEFRTIGISALADY